MATSGSLTTSAYSNRSITFSWSEKSQSIENNTTTISWNLKGSGSASGYYKAQNITLKLDGKVVYQHLKSEDGQIDLYNGTSITSGTYTFTHASDGSKDFTAYVEAGIYVWEPNCSGSKSFSLDDIPRQATITSAPDFNDEGNPVLKYSNPAGSAVDTLQACIATTGGTQIVSYRDISKTGTSYTFSLTDAERTKLRNQCVNANSMSVRFYVKTVIGDNTFRSYSTKTFSIINASPTISPTVKDTGIVSITLTGDAENKVIKGYNSMAITFGVSALKGATITSKKLTCGNKSLTADGTLNHVESGTFTFTATDSRGNTTTKTVSKTLINYIKPTININTISVSTDGEMTFTLKGNIFNGSFGAVDNDCIVEYRYKESGGDYGDWVALTATKSSNTYTASGSVSGLNYQTNYVFQGRVKDSIYDTDSEAFTTPEKSVSAKPVFSWDKDDFAINVNLDFGGNAVYGALYGLQGLKSVPSGSDLNDYKTPGVYAVSSNSVAGSLSNCPSTKAGRLIVYTATGGWGTTGTWVYLNQEYHTMNPSEPTYRRLVQTDGTANNWSYGAWYASATPTKVS